MVQQIPMRTLDNKIRLGSKIKFCVHNVRIRSELSVVLPINLLFFRKNILIGYSFLNPRTRSSIMNTRLND